MRIEQLEYLAAVTQYGSLRRASEHLHVSQPALSEALTKLERELGVPLLDRRRSGARISREGLDLLRNMQEVLEAVARLRAAAGAQAGAARTIRIGTVNAGTASLLLPAVRRFQDLRPESTVEIRNLQQSEIETGLAEGVLELGLVNLFDGDDVPPELEATAVRHGRPVAVLPAGHRLTEGEAVTVDDLRDEPFVGMRAGYLMHRFTHRLFGSAPPATWHSTDGAEMGKMMVAEGLGLTVLPDYSVIDDPLDRVGLITSRPIVGDRTTVTMLALHRRQARLSPTIRELIAILLDLAGTPDCPRLAS
ncbi:LysR family transcriptional regulator [Kribbella sp. NPDC056951]|uniref:LysR family transcriptional regulator n=1 Tax=Kribbella sp. NPDC056951 TaxID=3345978 RepID=UPI00363CFCF8